jgi:hypothetical protein
MIRIPALLEALIASGRWPKNAEEAHRQNLQPLIAAERVRRLAPDEQGNIYLASPPFGVIGRTGDVKDFFNLPSSDPGGIDRDLAIIIADFGIGSDAPIVLDYRESPTNPRVLRLRYNDDSPPLVGKWVELTPDFATFVDALGLY